MIPITRKFYFTFSFRVRTRKFYLYLLFRVSNSEILLFLFVRVSNSEILLIKINILIVLNMYFFKKNL